MNILWRCSIVKKNLYSNYQLCVKLQSDTFSSNLIPHRRVHSTKITCAFYKHLLNINQPLKELHFPVVAFPADDSVRLGRRENVLRQTLNKGLEHNNSQGLLLIDSCYEMNSVKFTLEEDCGAICSFDN